MAGAALEPIGRSPIGGQNPLATVRRMSLTQQLIMGGAFVAVVGLVFLAGRLASSATMGILYSDLEPKAAAEVADELESRGIEYELSDGGRVVWVPRELVASTRLDMSTAGLPESSGGWSVLDNQGITASEFDQRVGFQRAMEGELASTIAVIDGVASANVHLVIPEQDLFVDDVVMASASVLVRMEGDATLAPTQTQAIVNLVASAVEGLQASDVTVTDGAGRLLAGGDTDGVAGIESDNQMRAIDSFETDLERRLTSLLAAVVGDGRAVVTVAADLDFDAVQTTEEQYSEPVDGVGGALPRAETTRTEQYDNGAAAEEGVVDIETEILDGPAAATDGNRTNYLLDERDVSFALNSVVTTTQRAPGSIRSLSVSVVIDEAVLDAGRVGEIEAMVGAAVGADAARGDVVAVNLLPFELSVEEQQEVEAAAALAAEEAASGGIMPIIRTAGASILALVVLVMGLRMLRKSSRRRVIDSVELASGQSGQVGAGDDDSGDDATGSDPTTEAGGVGTAEPVGPGEPGEDDLFELIENQPDDIAAVLRQWLTQPDEAAPQEVLR